MTWPSDLESIGPVPTQIYAVTSSDYEDYTVHAVFSRKEWAEAYIESFNSSGDTDIEPWKLDATDIPGWRPGLLPYEAEVDQTGAIRDIGRKHTHPGNSMRFFYPTPEAEEIFLSLSFLAEDDASARIRCDEMFALAKTKYWQWGRNEQGLYPKRPMRKDDLRWLANWTELVGPTSNPLLNVLTATTGTTTPPEDEDGLDQ